MRRTERAAHFIEDVQLFSCARHARETSGGRFFWFSGEDSNIMINILETSLEQFENMDDV